MAKTKPKRKRAGTGQQKLPGVTKEIPAIEKAAEYYVNIRDRRMTLTKDEVDAQTKLVAAMKEAGLDLYKTVGGMTCTLLVGKEKVKVRAAGQDGDGAHVEE